MDGSALLVKKVLADSPAERAGLVVGDRILAIDGRSTAQLGAERLSELLKGKEGTPVLLAVVSEAKEPRRVKVVRGDVVVPQVPVGVAVAAQAHLRIVEHAMREFREPAPLDMDAFGEAIAREVRYMARAADLNLGQSRLLADQAKKTIARRGALLAVKGDRLVRRYMIVVNGRRVLGAEESETLEQVARRELTQALRDLDRQAWEKFDAERERREERRRRSDALIQVAALDEALVLTAEQRKDFYNLLTARWRGQESDDEPPALVGLCTRATESMCQLSIPHVELESVLRASQLTAYAIAQSPEELARVIVPKSLPLDELRRRLKLLLDLLVEDADWCAALDDEQKQKLRLAGNLDLDRYFQEQAALEKPSLGRVLDARPHVTPATMARWPHILTNSASAFQKALRSRLRAEQRGKLAKSERDRVLFREQVFLQALAVALADRAALTDDQIEPLLKVFADLLCDPAADVVSACRRTMLRRLAQLQPEEMEPLLDDWQRPAARDYVSQVAEAARKTSEDGLQTMEQ